MDLQCLDHVHFLVPELARAKLTLGPFLRGEFVPDYGGAEMNAHGGWNTSGGDFIAVIDQDKPVFGGSPMPGLGIVSVSFRVDDIDEGIAYAQSLGLELRSRIGSEDIGLGKNVIQAQFAPEAVPGLPMEFVEHQLPGEYTPLTDAAVDHIEFGVPGAFEPAVESLERIFDSTFAPEVLDETQSLRTRQHRRLGIRLTSPLSSGNTSTSTSIDTSAGTSAGTSASVPVNGSNTWQPGLRAIGFHCANLDQEIETAQRVGLVLAREYTLGGLREVEFEPFSNMIIRLVERKGEIQ